MENITEKISKVADIANLIYSSYVGRDFFAKIIPGFIGLVSVKLIFFKNGINLATIKDLPFMVWILIFGLCYATGFVIQIFGETFYIVQLYGKGWNSTSYSENVEKFFKSNMSIYHRSQRERFVVIKELYGNLASCLTIVLLFLLLRIKYWICTWENIVFVGMLVIAIFCLIKGNRKSCNTEKNWIINSIKE